MAKDVRYISVKSLIETGRIENFRAIFKFIPKKVVYTDLGINYNRFKRLLANPDLFSLRELTTLSKLFEMDPRATIEMVYSQHEADTKGKRKK